MSGLFVEEHARRHLQLLVDGADPNALVCLAHAAGEWRDGRYVLGPLTHTYFAVDGLDAALLTAEAAVGRGEDVYVLPHPRATQSAKKGSGWPAGRVLWADCDDASPHDAVRRVLEAGGFVVFSGTAAHFHGYAQLAEPVPVEEVERLNKLLRDGLGGDHKVAENTLLRLAGTRNFKTGGLDNGAAPVRLLAPGVRPLAVADVERLGQRPSANGAGSRKKANAQSAADATDRSGRSMAYIASRARQGLTVDAILDELLADAAAFQRGEHQWPDAADAFWARDKFGNGKRLREEVERVVRKVREEADREHGEADDDAGADLPGDEFWTARPALTTVREFARARRAGPWATLGAVLARLVAATAPHVVLPPLVGGEVSLNLFVGLVGPSGSGKDAATSAAEDALRFRGTIGFATVNLGSGEGIAHQYVKRTRDGLERLAESVLFSVAEIDTLLALGSRQGSTVLAELRKAWMGSALGFAYADPSRRLPVERHSYRLCMVAGIQPVRAGVLLDDADAGTPQRWTWLPATDPGVRSRTRDTSTPATPRAAAIFASSIPRPRAGGERRGWCGRGTPDRSRPQSSRRRRHRNRRRRKRRRKCRVRRRSGQRPQA